MKVILLTNQLIQNKDTFIIGGWIQSLIGVLQQSPTIELAVIGLTDGNSCVEKENNTTYYKICDRKSSNPLVRIYQRFRCKIQDKGVLKDCVSAILDFKPDIVQIFGTESFACGVIPYIGTIKTVVHLQGLLNPYMNVWFPPGISKNTFYFYSFNLFQYLKGNGQRQQHGMFQAMAKRELEYFQSIRYVMGRTHWDKLVARILSKEAQYFHVEEVLRPDFYTDLQWSKKERNSATLISVLSSSSYKGFDLILKTAVLLKSQGIEFQWLVCGPQKEHPIIKAMERIFKQKFAEYNVSFLGKRTAKDLVSLFLDADIFIHPSYIENSPNSLCEAQILGLPVVATDVGGISSLIKNNETGILFPANDPYSLCEIVTSLLSDSQKMQHLGTNARNEAKKRHNRDMILKNIETVYREIILK